MEKKYPNIQIFRKTTRNNKPIPNKNIKRSTRILHKHLRRRIPNPTNNMRKKAEITKNKAKR